MVHDWKLRIRDDDAIRVDAEWLQVLIARCCAALGLEAQAASSNSVQWASPAARPDGDALWQP